jgi:D-alanyl-D-alanine carboxypeptidase (penicillin-binding protein 5/6)
MGTCYHKTMMKKKSTWPILRLLLALLIVAGGFGFIPNPALQAPLGQGEQQIDWLARQSPFLSTAYADQQATDLVAGTPLADSPVSDAPNITSPSALVATADGTILWERGGLIQRPMASTTKIMTAVVALEHASLDMQCTVTMGAANTDGSSAWIMQGDVASLYDLLVGLMVNSGNDAAVAIAENVAGDVFTFVDMMNTKAQELGMKNTHFVDPNGLGEDGLHSTAEDYLILTRYAMRNETFRSIVCMHDATVYINGRQIDYFSTNKLFYRMDGVIGVKTGTNYMADNCLVACIDHDGMLFYTVVFGAPSDEARYDDTVRLFEWAFYHYRHVELINSNTLVADLALKSWPNETVPVRAPHPVAISVFDYGGPILQEVELADWEGSISRGQKVGRIIWSQNGEVLATSDLVADAARNAPTFWENISIKWDRFVKGIGGNPGYSETKVYLPGTFEIPIGF